MPGALEDVFVIDFTQNAAGPTASGAMSDLGARVIKIEPMGGAAERTHAPIIDGVSLTCAWYNRGKESITLDINDPECLEIVYKLVEKADVFMESGIPGSMDRKGLGYEKLSQINPALVYTSVTGFGSKGPLATKPSYDVMGQALSGMMSTTGEKGGAPLKHGITIADLMAGLNAYAATVSALHYARRTGIGQHVETSLIQGMVHINSGLGQLVNNKIMRPNGNHHGLMCPFGCFTNSKMEAVIICAVQPKQWKALCEVIGKPEWADDPDFANATLRGIKQEEIIPVIEAWLEGCGSIDAAVEQLEAAGVPNSPVLDCAQVVEYPQVVENNYLVEAETPLSYTRSETYLARNHPATFFGTPTVLRRGPDLGEHNHAVLEELGYTPEQVDALMERLK